jgi:phosphohistidine phosphatase
VGPAALTAESSVIHEDVPMRRLIIARHAHAEPERTDGSDFERRLDPRGLLEAPRMARELAARGTTLHRIIASPAARTLATARAFAEVLDVATEDLVTDPRIYSGDVATLESIVRAIDPAVTSVLLVGHNPTVSRLVGRLIGESDFDDVVPATVCVLEAPIEDWRDAAPGLFDLRLRRAPADLAD